MVEPRRLDDAAVQQRLARLDELLEAVEQAPGPTSEAAIEAVQALTAVYGEALARVLDHVSPHVRQLADDELLGHLLVLHDLHPDSVADRVRRALANIRPQVESRGGRIEFVAIEHGVARIRLSSGGCGSCSSSAAELEKAVTESVLALAPELTGVETVPNSADGRSVIPVESVLSRTRAGRSG